MTIKKNNIDKYIYENTKRETTLQLHIRKDFMTKTKLRCDTWTYIIKEEIMTYPNKNPDEIIDTTTMLRIGRCKD